MDQAALLLGAMRAKARSSAARLSTAEVEALADAVGVGRSGLPGLMAELEAAGRVKLVWGGAEVLPEPAGRVGIEAPTAPPGGGATLSVATEFRLGELAGVLQELRALLPRLRGVAAESARSAEALLAARPAPDASDEERGDWGRRLMSALNELVSRAPESEAILDLAERARKAVERH